MHTSSPEQFTHAPNTAPDHRVLWIDALRLLCAIEIVGFHWLRAAAKTGAFASQLPRNFILDYRQLNIGVLEAFRWLRVDSSVSRWHRWSYDTMGIIFGFGWEAVYVFVLLSGLSLAMSLGPLDRPSTWFLWVRRRLRRLLAPYYLISISLAALMLAAFSVSAAFPQIHQKLADNIGSDRVGLIWSQVLLIDPHEPYLKPTFLAPAWWFVPAVLLAYGLFPFYLWLLRQLGRTKFLMVGATVTVLSYRASLDHGMPEYSWTFIVLNECFNFFLGIVLGRYMVTQKGRTSVEKWVRSPQLLLGALATFICGNVCNVYRLTYPISSIVFTAALALCAGAVARIIIDQRASKGLLRFDSYHLYLLHQPFAFPLILGSQMLFGREAAIVGLPLYLCLTLLATAWFSKFFERIST